MSARPRAYVPPTGIPNRLILEAVRNACLDAAIQAYEDAGLQGLCEEGRWECAMDAIRRVDLQEVASGAITKP
jgi:hypothetical protein